MIKLESLIAAQKDKTISVAVYDFETGWEILINADQTFHPASTKITLDGGRWLGLC